LIIWLNSGSCLITGLSSGNGLTEGNLDDVSAVVTPALIVGNPVDDASVNIAPALIDGNPVDDVVTPALIDGKAVDDVSVDVTPALIGGNPADVDDWKLCC